MNIEKQINEILAVCEKATPGPWEVKDMDDCFIEPRICMIPGNGCYDYEKRGGNADFITLARTALPQLAQRVIELETEVSALREALGGEKVADWAYEAVKCRKETIAANTEKYKLREENAKLRAVAEAAEKLLQGRPPCPHCDGFAPPKECICEPWDLLHGALAVAGHRGGGAGGE
jgi:hypothetical protein